MIEEVPHPGAEIADLERPPRDRDAQSEFTLFIALAMQRREPTIKRGALFQKRSGDGKQRRRLVVPSPEGPGYPLQLGNLDRRSDPRVGRIFDNTRKPGTRGYRAPEDAADPRIGAAVQIPKLKWVARAFW